MVSCQIPPEQATEVTPLSDSAKIDSQTCNKTNRFSTACLQSRLNHINLFWMPVRIPEYLYPTQAACYSCFHVQWVAFTLNVAIKHCNIIPRRFIRIRLWVAVFSILRAKLSIFCIWFYLTKYNCTGYNGDPATCRIETSYEHSNNMHFQY